MSSHTMPADIESIKFTIDHIIESSSYTKKEMTELLTSISEYCDEKIADMSDDEEEEDSDTESSVTSEEEYEDYPFTTWSAYSIALTESLSSEFYSEKYPKYDAIVHGGFSTIDDFTIVADFVEQYHEDPQIILDEFIDIICNDGKRYALELLVCNGKSNIIDYLISKGATMKSNMLIAWKGEDYEADMAGNDIRATLIDYYFPKFGFNADKFKGIDAIEDDGTISEKYDMNNSDVYEKVINGDLKFKSKFLSSL